MALWSKVGLPSDYLVNLPVRFCIETNEVLRFPLDVSAVNPAVDYSITITINEMCSTELTVIERSFYPLRLPPKKNREQLNSGHFSRTSSNHLHQAAFATLTSTVLECISESAS